MPSRGCKMTEENPKGERKEEKSPWSYLNVGFQYAVTVCLFAGAGYWLDDRYGWAPWGVTIAALMGIAVATYLLLKETV